MAHLTFTRQFPAPGNFDVSAGIAWSEPIGTRAAGYLFLSIVDAAGNSIAYVGFADAWARFGSAYGTEEASLGSDIFPVDSFRTGPDTLPGNGSAVVGLTRVGGVLTATWNGVPMVSYPSTNSMSAVRLRYIKWPTVCDGGPFPAALFTDYVDARETGPTVSPHSVAACTGDPVAFAVTPIAGPATYEWQIEVSPGAWIPLDAATTQLPCGGAASAVPQGQLGVDIRVTPCAGANH